MGTAWFADPAAGLTSVLMTQVMWPSPVPPPLFTDFVDAAYGVLG